MPMLHLNPFVQEVLLIFTAFLLRQEGNCVIPHQVLLNLVDWNDDADKWFRHIFRYRLSGSPDAHAIPGKGFSAMNLRPYAGSPTEHCCTAHRQVAAVQQASPARAQPRVLQLNL